jgi:uncharacterized RDD family membrane protein YckC
MTYGDSTETSGTHPLGNDNSLSIPPLDELVGQPLATWSQRVFAFLIDTLLIWVPGGILLGVIYSVTGTPIQNPNGSTHTVHPNFGIAVTVVFVIQLLYFATLDGSSQTVGKRLVGIAVRSLESGQPVGFGRALVRWLIFGILWDLLFIPGFLNGLSPLWDRRNQAWHDHAVGSIVIKSR